jgi:hypothetical protein
MKYFQNIQSLADLKKQYRMLALAGHPDRGGSTPVMQEINLEFEKLYPVWEHRTAVSPGLTGYENDYSGSSAREYTGYVYNEYRWTGENYRGQCVTEIIEIIRDWLKKTYPKYRFSTRRRNCNTFCIYLLDADFVAFTPEAGNTVHMQINHYRIGEDHRLTDRAREVMSNVYDFVKSYNFDDSDSMTDYFHTNFYMNLGIGTYAHPYKIIIPKLNERKGDRAPQFKHPEGPAHKAIRQVLGRHRFSLYDTRSHGKVITLGEDTFTSNGEVRFYPLVYSSLKTAQKRMDKLFAAGIKSQLSGRNHGHILFRGYTEQAETALEKERQEVVEAMKAWNEKQSSSQAKG